MQWGRNIKSQGLKIVLIFTQLHSITLVNIYQLCQLIAQSANHLCRSCVLIVFPHSSTVPRPDDEFKVKPKSTNTPLSVFGESLLLYFINFSEKSVFYGLLTLLNHEFILFCQLMCVTMIIKS